jgi:hypothetical protein
MASDSLLFSSRVDSCSEREIVEALQQINYEIDNLVLNILVAQQTSDSPMNPHVKPDPTLLSYLNGHPFSDANARVLVVEYLLRNMIFVRLHAHYFDGVFFSGVGSDSLQVFLERLMAEFIEGGTSQNFPKSRVYF